MMIRLKQISFSYAGRPVLSDLSLNVNEGEILGIMGPNGVGKSTLLKLMGGMLTPTTGAVRIDERDLASLPARERAQRIAFVPQEHHIPFSFTALETVLMGRAPYLPRFGFERQGDLEAAHAAMEATDCLALAARDITTLSGGERQRVIIARALAQGSPLVLLDEPTAFLDIRHATRLLELLARLHRDRDLTIVAALHDLNVADALCHRIVLLADGGIAADGAPETILTPEIIQRVFGIAMHAGCDAATGRRYLLPTASAR